MTTVIPTSHGQVTTPNTSYISRWIAQSHGAYAKNSNEFYSSISNGCRTTTWQAQAQARLNLTPTINSTPTHSQDLEEKLNQIRTQLDAKKQRLSRQSSSSLNCSLSTTAIRDCSTHFPSENAFYSSDETMHHHHHLPCLIEESPSDSGCSDATKVTHVDDLLEKNAALIDLSKPMSKEEILAIFQILRELWKKQFGCEIPNISSPKAIDRLPSTPSPNSPLWNSRKKSHYHSTPALNKLTAELSDIKDKLKRFATGEQRKNEQLPSSEVLTEKKSTGIELQITGESLVFIPLGPPLTTEDFKRMQRKKDFLIGRQIQRREEQLIKRNQRLIAAAQHQNDFRFYEDYVNKRREEDEQRRQTILKAHIDQKRREADPPSSNDFYFAAARTRNRLKRKASIASFDDEISYGGSTFDLYSGASGKKSTMQTPKRTSTAFDFLSSSLTASTAASRSKMNRAASICNINEHYDSFTSLNSKATIPLIRPTRPSALFGGSLMNINLMNKQRTNSFLEDPFDSPLTGSLSSLALSNPTATHLAPLSTRSNRQAMINAVKQIVLAGPANDQQRQHVLREIELSDARHLIILFRDHRLQFRAIYMYIPETDLIEKLYGIGPNIITEIMVEKWFKFNSGSKRFTTLPIRHFSIQCDAVTIYNDFWQKKSHNR